MPVRQNPLKDPEELRAISTLKLERLIARLSDDPSRTSWRVHLKDHWASGILMVLFGLIGFITYPSENLVPFLGLLTIVCAIQGENHAKETRRSKDLAEALEAIRLLLENDRIPDQPAKSPETAPTARRDEQSR